MYIVTIIPRNEGDDTVTHMREHYTAARILHKAYVSQSQGSPESFAYIMTHKLMYNPLDFSYSTPILVEFYECPLPQNVVEYNKPSEQLPL